MSIFTILFVILLIGWILLLDGSWVSVFSTSPAALIHIRLVVALISLVLHFIRSPRAA
jgi:hypothetical protein